LAGVSLRGWRCWWHPPFGHVDELIDYVEPLSGRWAARIRCARCGREKGLAIGLPRHGNVYPGNPLATMLSRQGVRRSFPPGKKIGVGPAGDRPGAVEIETPDGTRVLVRSLAARLAFGRLRIVYLAVAVDGAPPPVVSRDLLTAHERVCGGVNEQWLERMRRQLEAELPAGS
jgi:hypothetical protein